jgi:hypothetical protein
MIATTVTGMGDGLLADYVLNGCLAYLRGFRIGQPMSTQMAAADAQLAGDQARIDTFLLPVWQMVNMG